MGFICILGRVWYTRMVNENEYFVSIFISSWIRMNLVILILVFGCILECKVGITICFHFNVIKMGMKMGKKK